MPHIFSSAIYPGTGENNYPERYIFLVLSIAGIIRLMKTLQRCRNPEEFSPILDDLDVDSGDDLSSELEGLGGPSNGSRLHWNDLGISVSVLRSGETQVEGYLHHDPYQAAVSTLPPPNYTQGSRALGSTASRDGAKAFYPDDHIEPEAPPWSKEVASTDNSPLTPLCPLDTPHNRPRNTIPPNK